MSNFPKYRMSYLNTIKETALKQFFKGVAHEQHWSSILCLWWWSSIVSSFFLKWKFSNFFFSFPFSFPLVFLSYFLISIILDFSKCQFPKILDVVFKPHWKNSTQTISQGGSPWATLIFNSMVAVGVLYCVQFFFDVFFSKILFSFPLL